MKITFPRLNPAIMNMEGSRFRTIIFVLIFVRDMLFFLILSVFLYGLLGDLVSKLFPFVADHLSTISFAMIFAFGFLRLPAYGDGDVWKDAGQLCLHWGLVIADKVCRRHPFSWLEEGNNHRLLLYKHPTKGNLFLRVIRRGILPDAKSESFIHYGVMASVDFHPTLANSYVLPGWLNWLMLTWAWQHLD